ncbi:hypothetical protein ACQKIC_02200 [Peribacillus sp. NPDC046944]|uniref:hypothetical protein n=1 Tax=unclassified Peribacillus TaxID=2675266 RepID=UPI00381029CE
MKRYISSILIVVVMILSIGTYYAQVTSYASNLPKLTFKTIEGDETELESVLVSGMYEEGSSNESFRLESNQLKYEKERSYYENLLGYYDPNYNRLVKEYRSFMRGKAFIETYYEDQDNLTIVTMNGDDKNGKYSLNFIIDSLAKKNKEEKSFEIDVPEQAKYENIIVRDVQFVQSKLQILTQNDVKTDNEKDTDEIHLYTIDLAGKKVVADETLLSETFDSSNEGHFAMPSKVDRGMANHVFLLALVKGRYSEEGGFTEKKRESSLYAYHYDTKKLEKIKIPNEKDITFESVESDFSVDGETLYVTGWEEGMMHILTFDIDKQKVINDYKPGSVDFTEIKDGRIFAITADELLIVDAKTGKTLYRGKLVKDSHDQKKDKNYLIQLHDVIIK